jgi:hypothetical protein
MPKDIAALTFSEGRAAKNNSFTARLQYLQGNNGDVIVSRGLAQEGMAFSTEMSHHC